MNAVPKRERVHRMAFKHVAADENETPRDFGRAQRVKTATEGFRAFLEAPT
jgi:hypothetical protein